MGAGALADDLHGFLNGEGFLVAAAGDQGVENVRHRHDPGAQRDLLPLQPPGIAGAVPFFVMIQGQVPGLLQIAASAAAKGFHGGIEDHRPLHRVLLHPGVFLIRQPALLVQQQVGHPDLSDIMQRRRIDQILNILLRQLLRIEALFPHPPGDDAYIGGGMLDVVAGIFIPVFHQVGHNGNQALLELGQGLVLLLGVGNVSGGILGGLDQRVIQVLRLVPGPDIQIADPLHRALPGGFIGPGEISRRPGHLVNRLHHVDIGQMQRNRQQQNENRHKQGKDFSEERLVFRLQLRHADVHRRVGLADALAVINGLVGRQKPPEGVVGYDGIDGFSRQKIRNQPGEGFVEGDQISRLSALHLRRVDVEDHMASVFQNPVDVNVLQAAAGGQDPGQVRLGFPIARRGLPFRQIGVDPIRIDHGGGQPGHVLAHRLPGFHGGGFILQDADRGNPHGHQRQRQGNKQNHPGFQGILPFDLRNLPPAVPPAPQVEQIVNPLGQKGQNRRRGQNADCLVRQVDAKVRQHPGPEGVPDRALHQPLSQPPGDPLPDASPIDEPGHHRAERAAYQRHAHDPRQKAPRAPEESPLRHPACDQRDRHIQHRVVDHPLIAEGQDNIGGKAHGDARDVACQRRRQNRPQAVQIQGKGQGGSQPRQQNIRRNTGGRQTQHRPGKQPARRLRFLRLIHGRSSFRPENSGFIGSISYCSANQNSFPVFMGLL